MLKARPALLYRMTTRLYGCCYCPLYKIAIASCHKCAMRTRCVCHEQPVRRCGTRVQKRAIEQLPLVIVRLHPGPACCSCSITRCDRLTWSTSSTGSMMPLTSTRSSWVHPVHSSHKGLFCFSRVLAASGRKCRPLSSEAFSGVRRGNGSRSTCATPVMAVYQRCTSTIYWCGTGYEAGGCS
jgi:hypothetical protein